MKSLKLFFSIYKPLGLTPIDFVKGFKERFPEYSSQTVSYAGRLDPMATGVVLLLIGEENKKREKYLHLDKEYMIQVLFGIETDTYDILGKVIGSSDKHIPLEKLTQCVNGFRGEVMQNFPPYSSKRVNGRPLFYWARENKLNGITIPSAKRHIFDISLRKHEYISKSALRKKIFDKLLSVKGNFRQDEIRETWSVFFPKSNNSKYLVADIYVRCSSGTYMRTLAYDIGRKLTSGAMVLNIERTSVGEFELEHCIRLNDHR